MNGKKILSLRTIKQLSLREFSRLSGGAVSPSHLSEIENGKVSNPTKRVTRAIAKVLGVRETELFSFEENIKGEFMMCTYRREYPTMNGWVYYCELVAKGIELTREELSVILGCDEHKREECRRMMEFTCGIGLVPQPKD